MEEKRIVVCRAVCQGGENWHTGTPRGGDVPCQTGRSARTPDLLAQRAGWSVGLRQRAAMDLPAANDVELDRLETRPVGMVEDVRHVLQVDRLVLVQADQDVAALQAGPRRHPALAHVSDQQSAAQLRVAPTDRLGADRLQ